MSSRHSRPECFHVWPLGWSAVAQSHCPKSPRHTLTRRPIERQRDRKRWRWHSTLPGENCMKGYLRCTCPGVSVTASNMPPYDSSAVQVDKIRLLCSISVALRRRSPHELWFTVTVSPSQEDRWTEIVLLLIHSSHSKGVVSGWVCCEITMHEQSVIFFSYVRYAAQS